jgi:hypothetical protein
MFEAKAEIAESVQLQFAIDWFSVVCKFLIFNFLEHSLKLKKGIYTAISKIRYVEKPFYTEGAFFAKKSRANQKTVHHRVVIQGFVINAVGFHPFYHRGVIFRFFKLDADERGA